ncbi:MAG: MurT ligase domain-containing protein [Bifidobacterium sp.]|jgi:UDP-N-acetylmuramyl tripeptide synthase
MSRSVSEPPARGSARIARPWYAWATLAIGKTVRVLSRLLHHGGSALPGRVVERFDPGFLARTLDSVPYGVVLVSGTNGKTTTTRMIASMLRDLGLRVFTNPTGSNFTRGVVSALSREVSLGGGLDADIAVLELDEAYAVHFVRQVRPRYSLLLNVMRDQLDRFGEIDNTARLLSHVARSTTGTVVLNREDLRIAALADVVPDGVDVRYFGLSSGLRPLFPSDDDMHSDSPRQPGIATRPDDSPAADVTLLRAGDHEAEFLIDGRAVATQVKIDGVYNLYNAAAALSVVRCVIRDVTGINAARPDGCRSGMHAPERQSGGRKAGDIVADRVGKSLPDQRSGGEPAEDARRRPMMEKVDTTRVLRALSQVTAAFGRGEVISIGKSTVELILVKNPMGFRLALASFDPNGYETMVAIGDEYADGRDMSWLWDVDFTSLRSTGVAMVSGIRAWDMTLRLKYDQVAVGTTDTDLEAAVREFVLHDQGMPKRIYCTYTSMLRARAQLAQLTEVSDAGVGR